MSLYLKEIPKPDEIDRKANVLPRNAVIHDLRKETLQCLRVRGIMTVEAAIILPLLTCFFVSILFFFRIMQVQIVTQDALNRTGRQMALFQEEDTSASLAIAKGMFWKEIEEKELVNTYVEAGAWGIDFGESIFDKTQIHLKIQYKIQLPIQFLGGYVFDIQQRADCRRWNGWQSGNAEDTADVWVYVTETGDAYHMRENCTHLDLSIRSVGQEQLPYLRNEAGACYVECRQCRGDISIAGTVYITNQGDCYHNNLGCSGIKRTVYIIRRSEVGSRKCCSRCGLSDWTVE